MPLTPYLAKALLDWSLGGATPTRPVGRFIGFASGSPTTASDSAAALTRATATFSAANSPAGSVVLAAPVTCSCTAAAQKVLYWNLYDGVTASTRLAYGTLTASALVSSGSAAFFVAGTGAGSLTMTLS
jgi:hypothetical protein